MKITDYQEAYAAQNTTSKVVGKYKAKTHSVQK